MSAKIFDVVVVGSGTFGAWTAHALRSTGQSVLLLDAFGPAHSRASSGGESRVIRMGYGHDALYTRLSLRSLESWKALAQRTRKSLFQQTGMLWLAGKDDGYVDQTRETLVALGVEHAALSVDEVSKRFPQIATDGIGWALWEPNSGALMARQAVQALVADDMQDGLEYRIASVIPPKTAGRLPRLATTHGDSVSAGTFVFACGAWLARLFPELLGQRIFPTRQEVFFFAPPPGDASFSAPAMPAWFHHPSLVYGIPDLENRGFKVSVDRHGPAFDPDSGSRVVSAEGLATAREFVARTFPKLANAPLTEARVCQYENTANGDFILDRHPHFDNVWIGGGGSGHGFKHGPAVGEYLAGRIADSVDPEPRFALASKATVQAREIF
ncbi:MAG: FAD-dependent oxidoreductase [Dokdonella sp.]